MPFSSEEERQQFQRRFQQAADKPEHIQDRELYRRLLRRGFSPERLQEGAYLSPISDSPAPTKLVQAFHPEFLANCTKIVTL